MNTETEPSLTDILTAEPPPLPDITESPPGDVSVFPCPKCGKEFKSPPALRMHNIRAHGKGWSTTGNLFKRQSEEERLAKKRAYNRKYRKSKGMGVRPASFKENQQKRKVGGYKGMSMPKWSLARRRKFNAKRAARAMEIPNGKAHLSPAKQRALTLATEARWKPKPVAVVQSVTFCPRCGCNIEVVRKAIEFADRV